jgi:hypothetical protein
MKTKLVYAIVLTLFVQIVHAQIFGIRGGVNIANLTITSQGTDIASNSVTGFHLGPVADFKLKKNLHLNTGLLYSSKGYKISLDAESTTYKMNYLDVPLNLAYNFPLGNKSYAFIQSGPYLGYVINGKLIFGSESEAIKIGEGGLKRYDLGLGFGAGLGFRSFTASLNYQLGLTNLNNDPEDDSTLKNRVIQLSVAILFPHLLSR